MSIPEGGTFKMDTAAQGQSPAPLEPEQPQASNTWARLGIFIGFAVAFIVITVQFIPSGLSSDQISKSAEQITSLALKAALAGWAFSWAISGKWLTLKKTMLIALVLYAGLGLWLYFGVSAN